MSLPALIAAFNVAVGAVVAVQTWPLSRAPGWADLRWFSLAALTGAAATACTLGSILATPTWMVPWAGRLQLLFLALHVAAWWVYGATYLRRPLGARGKAVALACVALGLASLVPGLAYGSRVWTHTVPWLGASYSSAEPTAAGLLVFAGVAAVPVALVFRMAAAWRRGVDWTGMLALAFAVGTLLGVHDAVVVASRLPMPYLLEVGLVPPVVVIAWANLARHASEARALERHRQGLADAVRERTQALEAARAALLEAERAAAVGHFSARLAHEMNGPVAAVAANLRYLVRSVGAQGSLPPDGVECLAESRDAIERVGRISRKIADAARLASPLRRDEPEPDEEG